MISASEFKSLEHRTDVMQDIETHVDNAIRQCTGLGIVRVNVRNQWYGVIEIVLDKYRANGWSARVIDDWRDGDFIELEAK